MLVTMDALKIDGGIRELVGQLWEHGYKTTHSCGGHKSKEAYIIVTLGDGWFEKHAHEYGLRKVENNDCCSREFQDEISKYGLDPNNFVDRRKTCGCGAGVNGHSVYRGRLI